MVDYVLQNNLEKVALLSVNNDYGKGLVDEILRLIPDRISVDERFGVAETDFRLMLSKAKEADIILLVGYTNNTTVLLRQKSELGIQMPVLGSVASFTTDLLSAEPSISGDYLVSLPNINPEGAQKFKENYFEKYGEYPKFPAEFGYDNVIAVYNALKDVNFDVEKLRDSLHRLNIKGASGNIGFDENGDRVGAVLKVYEVESNDLVCKFNCN